jgi:putative membrane protein
MALEILIRYLHFISIITLVASVLGQHLTLRGTIPRRLVILAQRLDIVYAISVIVVLATGFSQWFLVGKPAEFYSSNPVFHAKITLFLVIGLVSIYPSVFLGKNRKGDPDGMVEIPKSLVWTLRGELFLLFLMPLLATLMAKGIGIPLVTAP